MSNLDLDIVLKTSNINLKGNITVPNHASSIILFAHGSGSSRLSPRNRHVADVLNREGFATLLFDLLTAEEESVDVQTAQYRFDIVLLASRLIEATHWLLDQPAFQSLNVGYFGSSTGAAAALIAAAELPNIIKALVSRGGRPDLAGEALPHLQAPTLLIVGELDVSVIALNREAKSKMETISKIQIIPGASHLFEEPGTLDKVTEYACQWFRNYL